MPPIVPFHPAPGASPEHVYRTATAIRGTMPWAEPNGAPTALRVTLGSDSTERPLSTWWAFSPAGDRILWSAQLEEDAGPASSAYLDIETAAGSRRHHLDPIEHPDPEPIDGPDARQAASLARVQVFPAYGTNPYLNMLKLEALSRGYTFTGDELLEAFLERITATRPEVLHIHWPAPVTERAADAEDAMARGTVFLAAIREAQRRGSKVLWTVHNVLPHDARFPDAARLVHGELAQIADRILLLTSSGLGVVESEYEIPAEKVTVLRHSSYAGIYGARSDRSAALQALGADDSARSVLFFGQMRPYKGLEALLEAARATEAQLLLAGKPTPEIRSTLRAMLASRPATHALRFIDDDEVATWFSAADVTVLPYQKVLNSGTVHLAATFGVPCVLPDEPHLREYLGGQSWVRFFDVHEPVDSIRKLIDDPWYLSPDAHEAALAFSRAYTPAMMSADYADILDSVRMLAAGSAQPVVATQATP